MLPFVLVMILFHLYIYVTVLDKFHCLNAGLFFLIFSSHHNNELCFFRNNIKSLYSS